MNYIKAWQSLPDFGITLFVVKFMDHKKEELLGVAFNRLMKMDINTGYHRRTWRFSNMKVSISYYVYMYLLNIILELCSVLFIWLSLLGVDGYFLL